MTTHPSSEMPPIPFMIFFVPFALWGIGFVVGSLLLVIRHGYLKAAGASEYVIEKETDYLLFLVSWPGLLIAFISQIFFKCLFKTIQLIKKCFNKTNKAK